MDFQYWRRYVKAYLASHERVKEVWPIEKETQMQSYSYEVIVKAKYEEGEIVREAQIIDSKSGLLDEPTREDVLLTNAKKIKDLDVKATEVVVNVSPFLGK